MIKFFKVCEQDSERVLEWDGKGKIGVNNCIL